MNRPDEEHVMQALGQLMDRSRTHMMGDGVQRLRPSQFRVIGSVPSEHGITVTELADRVGMTKQGVGQFVAQLTEDGYLCVVADPDDRRVRLVRRTALADEAVRELAVRLRELEREWSQRVGARRYATFRAVLDELAGEVPG